MAYLSRAKNSFQLFVYLLVYFIIHDDVILLCFWFYSNDYEHWRSPTYDVRKKSKGYGTARAGVDENILPDFYAQAPVEVLKNVQNITFTKQDVILHPCMIFF